MTRSMTRRGLVLGLPPSLTGLAAGAVRAEEARRMKVGETITIPLSGNPSTGYAWTLDTTESRGLDLVSVAEAAREPKPKRDAPPIVGAPTMLQWRVTALKPGEAVLVFGYMRSWEKGPPAKQERVHLTISAR